MKLEKSLFSKYINLSNEIEKMPITEHEKQYLMHFQSETKPPRMLDIGCWKAKTPSKLSKNNKDIDLIIFIHGYSIKSTIESVLEKNLPSNLKLKFVEWL